MRKREYLGQLELMVLLAAIRIRDMAYGVPIAREIEKESGRDVALASVYAALERLEKKGLITSALGEPTAERGGKARTYFKPTAAGFKEARAAHDTLMRLGSWLPGPQRTARMTVPKPPILATWLLRRLNSGYHTDSLAGDLIEEYARGRSRAWYWRQVLIVILNSIRRAAAALTHCAARRVLFRLVAEAAAVLTIVTFVDQSRRINTFGMMWTPIFMETVISLAALTLIAFLLSRPHFGYSRRHTAINYLVVVFAVVALGAGTLTWADAVRSTCKTDSCLCSKYERLPQPKH